MQIDSLIARGVISPRAADRLAQNVAQVPGQAGMPPVLGPEMGRGGGRAGASGEQVVAPDYGAGRRAFGTYSERSALDMAKGLPNEAELLKSRIRQLQYDRSLAKKAGVDTDSEGYAGVRNELNDLRSRLNDLADSEP